MTRAAQRRLLESERNLNRTLHLAALHTRQMLASHYQLAHLSAPDDPDVRESVQQCGAALHRAVVKTEAGLADCDARSPEERADIGPVWDRTRARLEEALEFYRISLAEFVALGCTVENDHGQA